MSNDAWSDDEADVARPSRAGFVPVYPNREPVDLGRIRQPIERVPETTVPSQQRTVLRRELGDGQNSKDKKTQRKTQTPAQREREYERAKARIFQQAEREKAQDLRKSAKSLRGKQKGRGKAETSPSTILSVSKAEKRRPSTKKDPDFDRDYSRYSKTTEKTHPPSYDEEFPQL